VDAAVGEHGATAPLERVMVVEAKVVV